MESHLDTGHYRELRAELTRLNAAPVRDMVAIDDVIEQLGAEQLRLKALDGQDGNNAIEPQRHPLAKP